MELVSEQKRKEFIRLENSKTPYTPSENIMDYTGLVRGLNTELYERFGEVEKGFEYSTTGFVDAISFDGVLLWNSEMEVREWRNRGRSDCRHNGICVYDRCL